MKTVDEKLLREVFRLGKDSPLLQKLSEEEQSQILERVEQVNRESRQFTIRVYVILALFLLIFVITIPALLGTDSTSQNVSGLSSDGIDQILYEVKPYIWSILALMSALSAIAFILAVKLKDLEEN